MHASVGAQCFGIQALSFGILWAAMQAGQLGAEGRWLFCLCPGSSSSWVLTWLRKSVEKVVPQPVCSDRNGQNTATDTGFPAQVLQGLEVKEGLIGGVGWEAARGSLPCLSVCLSVPVGWTTGRWALQHWGHR